MAPDDVIRTLEPIERVVAEAGYDPDAIGAHDLAELGRFREILRLRTEGLRLIREDLDIPRGRDLVRRALALADAGPVIGDEAPGR